MPGDTLEPLYRDMLLWSLAFATLSGLILALPTVIRRLSRRVGTAHQRSPARPA
jgi:hypothetical protein